MPARNSLPFRYNLVVPKKVRLHAAGSNPSLARIAPGHTVEATLRAGLSGHGRTSTRIAAAVQTRLITNLHFLIKADFNLLLAKIVHPKP